MVIPAPAVVLNSGLMVMLGTASALALKAGVAIKDVDIKALQKQLAKQGVPLPDVKKKVSYKYEGPELITKQGFAIPH